MRTYLFRALMLAALAGLVFASFAPASTFAKAEIGSDIAQTDDTEDQQEQTGTMQDPCANLMITSGRGGTQQMASNSAMNTEAADASENQQATQQDQTDQDQQADTGQTQMQQGQMQGGMLTVGTGPRSANYPTDCWVSLSPDETHWYKFRYQGLPVGDAGDDYTPPVVNAFLTMDTPGCVDFWVMDPARLNNPDPDDDDVTEPVGTGTDRFDPDADDDRNASELVWEGRAEANVTFYILVMNDKNTSCAYNLDIEGAGVPVN